MRVLLAAAGILLLLGAPLLAQDGTESLEKEARKAVNAGQFRKPLLTNIRSADDPFHSSYNFGKIVSTCTEGTQPRIRTQFMPRLYGTETRQKWRGFCFRGER